MSNDPVDPRANAPDKESKTLRDRSRQALLTAGTLIALLATGLGFFMDSVGLWEYWRGLAGAAVATPAPTPFTAPTVMPTSTPPTGVISSRLSLTSFAQGDEISPTVTATPAVMAAPGETLLVVAQFANYAEEAGYNVAGRIQEALQAQIIAAKLTGTRAAVWPEAIVESVRATSVLTSTGAAMVIWGEYDSGRVRVRFALPGGVLDWQRLVSTPDELSAMINLDVPREAQALALMALGRLYRGAGKLDQAKAAFSQALAQNPSEPDTVASLSFYLGYLHLHSQPPDFAAAIAAYGRTIELRPAWINARYNRALVYLERFGHDGDVAGLNQAIADLNEVLTSRPRAVDALINRGIAYYTRNQAGDLTLALADFDQAISLDGKSLRGHYNRGLARIRAADRPGWEADLNRALAISPEYTAAHYALCWGYALDSLPVLGVEHCETAAAADSVGYTKDARGLVYAQLGRLDDAAADLENYLVWLRQQPGPSYARFGGPQYEEVVRALRAGENPLTDELLASLR
jgi:tetratricopeptide (TPR) repeat protein